MKKKKKDIKSRILELATKNELSSSLTSFLLVDNTTYVAWEAPPPERKIETGNRPSVATFLAKGKARYDGSNSEGNRFISFDDDDDAKIGQLMQKSNDLSNTSQMFYKSAGSSSVGSARPIFIPDSISLSEPQSRQAAGCCGGGGGGGYSSSNTSRSTYNYSAPSPITETKSSSPEKKEEKKREKGGKKREKGG